MPVTAVGQGPSGKCCRPFSFLFSITLEWKCVSRPPSPHHHRHINVWLQQTLQQKVYGKVASTSVGPCTSNAHAWAYIWTFQGAAAAFLQRLHIICWAEKAFQATLRVGTGSHACCMSSLYTLLFHVTSSSKQARYHTWALFFSVAVCSTHHLPTL